jgi:hypothetical protein
VPAGFLPATGTLSHLAFPDGVRADTGCGPGDTISPYYDPMIAKLIVHGPTRGSPPPERPTADSRGGGGWPQPAWPIGARPWDRVCVVGGALARDVTLVLRHKGDASITARVPFDGPGRFHGRDRRYRA